MTILETLKKRAASRFIKLTESLETVLKTHPDHTFKEYVLRIPVVDWKQVKRVNPHVFVQLLRSDELPRKEMKRFREEMGVVRPEVGTDWQGRDAAISAARAEIGMPMVSEHAAPNSEWAKRWNKKRPFTFKRPFNVA